LVFDLKTFALFSLTIKTKQLFSKTFYVAETAACDAIAKQTTEKICM